MKKIIILIAFVLLPNMFFAQQSVFDKFDGLDDVTSVLVTKKMFQMMGNVKMDANDKETQQFISLTKKLNNLKVFTTSNPKIKVDLKAAAEKYLITAGLEELMRVKDGNQNIRILVKSGAKESQIKELLMFIEDSGKDNETILMSLTGDFDLNELSVLTDKMNLPGGNVLNKTGKVRK
jgi:predicted Mrr-cat superfamily restriction endonuclease